MAGCAQSGDEQKNSLVSAVYFAIKMVSSSVQLANFAAKQMAASKEAPDGQEKSEFVCPFQVPAALSAWVPEMRPFPNEMLAVLNQAAQTMPDVTLYLGQSETFSRPALTVHLLDYLEQRLEMHGLHPWILPILTVHREFVRALFPPAEDKESEEKNADGHSIPAPLYGPA